MVDASESTAIVEAPAGRTKLDFIIRDGALVSQQPLPAGEGYRVVVQLRADASARPVNYRVDYHDETCPDCARAEYACTCEGHAGGDAHGHAH